MEQRHSKINSEFTSIDYTCLIKTSVNEIVQSELMNVFPNPVNDILHVEFPLSPSGSYEIQILNVFGQVVNNTTNEGTINIDALSKGIYIIVDQKGDAKYIRKILKE